VHALQFYDQGVDTAYAEILQQLDQVNARYTVAELQTVIRYLNEIQDVR
jgi:flagellin-specific chaperone FliS